MMIATAIKLFGDVLTGRAPPKVFIYRTRDQLNRWMSTGNRRFEFESLYSERGDRWDYATSPREHDRYRQTLDCILAHRRGAGSVLEIGCSVGVFTGLLAEHFTSVTAMDISLEALSMAKANNSGASNIEYVAEDIRRWKMKDKFDVIVGSDVLYYLRPSDGARLCDQIDKGLTPDGLLVTVTGTAWATVDPQEWVIGAPRSFGGAGGFDDWDSVLGRRFRPVYESDIMDERRPYRIVAFERR